ncbi:BamA/TamA family outer membrane protein [Alistipes senegalensis]|uniref:BamA/TamA family outer membrane protein n=1 Tax=Alistipes senegalensis TaxID=1288121 RepID=UPI00101CFF6B|nr:BamA/TamA family outer membrane protein [Alistipes senegalensis]
MVRRIVVLILVLSGSLLTGRAQEGTRVADGDTLHYTYTLLPQEAPRKKPFLRRVVDYFGESTTDKTFEKKIDFTFAGGPSYSKNTSFGIGLLAAGLFRLDRTDSITAPSDISIFANVSVSGFYALGVTGNTIFSHNKRRLNYTVMFASAPRSFWGIGYDAGRHNPESTYSEKRYLVEGRYLHEFLPHTYVGGLVSFEHTKGLKFTEPAYLRGEKLKYTATGIGAILEYDSRDFIPNPFRGVYVSFQETLFPKGLGNCGKTLWRTTFTADAYQRVWKDGVLAADLYAVFNTDGTPWPMLARMGGSQRMRGYYQGRYTDNDMITLQIELRQRIWRRIGCAVWGGAGNVFPSLGEFDWSQTLPNYGVGFRWELKKRVNVRLDYGFGKKTSGFLLSINEAF